MYVAFHKSHGNEFVRDQRSLLMLEIGFIVDEVVEIKADQNCVNAKSGKKYEVF